MYVIQFNVNLQGVFLTGPPLKMSLEPELIFVSDKLSRISRIIIVEKKL